MLGLRQQDSRRQQAGQQTSACPSLHLPRRQPVPPPGFLSRLPPPPYLSPTLGSGWKPRKSMGLPRIKTRKIRNLSIHSLLSFPLQFLLQTWQGFWVCSSNSKTCKILGNFFWLQFLKVNDITSLKISYKSIDNKNLGNLSLFRGIWVCFRISFKL
jgi:hypothetical protein